MKERLYKLARERLSVAEEVFTKGFYNCSASEIYFALFTLMRYVLSERQAQRWKHIGIFDHFSRECVERNIVPKHVLKSLGKANHELYYMRRKVDYGEGLDEFDMESVRNYIPFLKEVFEIVESRTHFGDS